MIRIKIKTRDLGTIGRIPTKADIGKRVIAIRDNDAGYDDREYPGREFIKIGTIVVLKSVDRSQMSSPSYDYVELFGYDHIHPLNAWRVYDKD